MKLSQESCDHPTCTNESEKTYRGKNDNTLSLCGRHYYNLVSEQSTHYIDTNSTEDTIYPFWDSGIRCDDTTSTYTWDQPPLITHQTAKWERSDDD